MLPELFKIGPFPIRAYGLMLAISFLLGVFYVKRMVERDGKRFDPYLIIAYILIFGGVIGARLFYVLFHLSDFEGNWMAVINPFHSGTFGIAGLNLYGGVIVAVVAAFAYCRWKGMSVLETFDYFAPTMGIGLIFTRIGCFMNGCCFGTPTNLPWGVHFPSGSIPYYQFGNTAIHPAQLYSSLYGVVLFLILHYLLKHKSFNGQLVAVLFMVEAFFRFVIEYVRFYEDAMMFSFLGMEPTYNQVISVVLFVLGISIYFYQRNRAPVVKAA
jgi:phosphatidylglycerol:prolipoprotein diacylglycerol transferase